DIGVCWRLSADLAARGHQVRLWVDDASALEWMAPQGHAGITVLPWLEPLGLNLLRLDSAPCEVLVEAFGCAIAPEFIAACAEQQRAGGQKPVWINLEYLSAEPYVARCHGLPSPVAHGPAAGWTKWFFYPGFTPETGGLLREPGLLQRQAAFDGPAWLAAQHIDWAGEKLLSLFCYEPPGLADLLRQFAREGLAGGPVRLLVAAGRGTAAVRTLFMNENGLQPLMDKHKLLSISYLPLLTQTDFDCLLWACDLNFVRGEDSVVRALWAGKPLVWQIYPQDDQAHHAKLQAFLDRLDAPDSLRVFHEAWNGANPDLPAMDHRAWYDWAHATRKDLAGLPDLASQLLGFVAKKS
ncbi:MAG: elongation factor P maturation arginine rhamnosyltransferase EarP, partial [Polaromonas sp.]|nr:elongation factor P maturation arginine rhamnosyltransferase EarP [Polaromonas sp.]